MTVSHIQSYTKRMATNDEKSFNHGYEVCNLPKNIKNPKFILPSNLQVTN